MKQYERYTGPWQNLQFTIPEAGSLAPGPYRRSNLSSADNALAVLPTGLANEYDPDTLKGVVEEARRQRRVALKNTIGAAARHLHRAIAGAARLVGRDLPWRAIAVSLTGSLLFFAVLHLLFHELKFLAFLAVFMASLLSSIAGFAFSTICGAMLFPLLDRPVHVVQIMLVCSIAIQSLSVLSLRNLIDWQHLGRFVVGGIAGLPIGIYLLMNIRVVAYQHVIGVFLIGYGLYMIARRPSSLRIDSAIGDCLVGFCGGVTGGFAAFPGAFVTIWCGLKGWDKSRQRGVFQPFILIMQVLALGAITLVRASQGSTGTDFLPVAYLPAALLGTWAGIAIFRRLTDPHFSLCVNLLLIVSGLGFIF